MPAAAFIAVGAATAIAGGIMSYSAAQQAANSQKDAAEGIASAQQRTLDAQVAQNNEQAAQERRKQIREARIQRANVENLAASSGQQSSSAAMVGAAGIAAGTASNVGAINTAQALSSARTEAQRGVVQAQSVAPEISPWGGVGSSLMNWGGSLAGKGIGKLFD